ncbi:MULTISPECIES: cell division protein FtsB [unclassified Massilia]|uniref:cell division protein FtsB n=1 Tax=unclassified Massilia TaxID=2609279 RepID=UPI0017856691|nr:MULTISPECIES: cell division protein FtsB [unclassified Massilia]MBD8530360.1 cell division protein FtsB [Massilia sp. CFBP 13647]MBD8673137.1 cell division protein FtsB [Massilia sp. CFBP 13721]
MRIITLVLAALLVLIQYPLWLGKGGMLAVADMRDQVQLAQVKTEQLKARNAKLESEVRDLREGTGAVEERARLELGMIKQNEIFVQVLRKDEQPTESMTVPPPPPAPKPGKGAAHAPTH